MLSRLYIQNIAVIEKVEVPFEKGLNIFTGETGAGKSIVIDAINAVLGNRTSRDLVRSGASKALVTALFERIGIQTKEKLQSLGFEPEEDDTLLLSREISADGKTKQCVHLPGFVPEHSDRDCRFRSLSARKIPVLPSFPKNEVGNGFCGDVNLPHF